MKQSLNRRFVERPSKRSFPGQNNFFLQRLRAPLCLLCNTVSAVDRVEANYH
jgi:hypothetical protein